MKFEPPDLPKNPSGEQWKWWKQSFLDSLEINEILDDKHKLAFLKKYAGSELYTLLKSASTFNDALNLLDTQFKTPTRILFARHELLTCSQNPGESVCDFVKRLKILVHRCECEDITAQEHQNLLLRDALVADISSDTIRARLLELRNEKATVEDCITLASAIEISHEYSRNFHTSAQDFTH